jgi:hypothetical protein
MGLHLLHASLFKIVFLLLKLFSVDLTTRLALLLTTRLALLQDLQYRFRRRKISVGIA